MRYQDVAFVNNALLTVAELENNACAGVSQKGAFVYGLIFKCTSCNEPIVFSYSEKCTACASYRTIGMENVFLSRITVASTMLTQ